MTTVTGVGSGRGRRLGPPLGVFALLLIPAIFATYLWMRPDAPPTRQGAAANQAVPSGGGRGQAAPQPGARLGPGSALPPRQPPSFDWRRVIEPLVTIAVVSAVLIALFLLVRGPERDEAVTSSLPPGPLPPQPRRSPPAPLPPHARRDPLPPPPSRQPPPLSRQPPVPRPPVLPPRPLPPDAVDRQVPPVVSPSLFANEGMWKVMAASVVGTSHAKTAKPCQDAAYCRILSGNLLVAAVADGAGSARYSDEGAQIAVKRAVDSVAEALQRTAGNGDRRPDPSDEQWPHMLQAAMQVALGHIELSAALRGAPARELATTLLLFVGLPQALIAAQVGDGAIVVRDPGGRLHAVTTPQGGEYANTTTFLVSPNALKTVQHKVWRGPYTNVAAFTDGLQRLALTMPAGEPHGPFFAPLFEFVEGAQDGRAAIDEIDAFLRSGKVVERADDDLTLMLARMTS